jgi:hypothetical protein
LSTMQTSPSPRSRVHVTSGTGLTAVGVLIAVAVSVVCLAMGSTNRTAHSNPARTTTATGYIPLIQYRGTGAPPTTGTSEQPQCRFCSGRGNGAARTAHTAPGSELIDNAGYGAVP